MNSSRVERTKRHRVDIEFIGRALDDRLDLFPDLRCVLRQQDEIDDAVARLVPVDLDGGRAGERLDQTILEFDHLFERVVVVP